MDIQSATVLCSSGFTTLAEIAHNNFDGAMYRALVAIAQVDGPVVTAQAVIGDTEVFVRAEAQPLHGGPTHIMFMTMRERIRDEMVWDLEMPAAAVLIMAANADAEIDP